MDGHEEYEELLEQLDALEGRVDSPEERAAVHDDCSACSGSRLRRSR